jgi:4-hydroxyphenylpyruvate dioxygenase
LGEIFLRRSIAAVSLGGGLQEKLYAIAAAGFDAVELTEAELAYSEMRPAQIRALLDELGLEISLFHTLAEIEGVAEAAFTATVARLQHKFELMVELNATLLRVPANSGMQALDDEQIACDQLATIAELASRHGIRVGYEPMANARFVRRVADACRIVTLAGHDNLGLVLDSLEVLAGGDSPDSIAAVPADRLFLVQLADAPALAVDIETLGRHFRCYPGQGVLDLTGFMMVVLQLGYTGTISLELLSDAARAAPIRSTALDCYRSLIHVEESLVRGGQSLPNSVLDTAVAIADTTEESIGFIEFAVSTDGQLELERWLSGLGFRAAGRHRSKDVSLYRQGDVLLVLNASTDSFAHYYHYLHGTSVCAIGLRVSDPKVLLARADLYKYKRYEERLGAREYLMPAVRAPDGSLIHLLGEEYDPHTDFLIDDDADTYGAGLLRVDHLARAVPEDQFDSWVLFYRALLGLSADKSLDLPDPHGVVRSRAMHDERNSLRLPLTFSDSARTVVAQSLSTFGGAGVNQIAFETSDIFASVERMQKLGTPILRIPANYYRELSENRDVPEDLVTRLQAGSILYDRDDKGGEFLHVYTEFFHGRFFFEVVQRLNGYDRYGECNAPVRLAVQARHPVSLIEA